MRPMDNPSELSPEQHLHELARMFAAGVLRLRQRRLSAGKAQLPLPEIARESSAERLAFGSDTVLSVTNPVDGPESPKSGAPA